MRAFPILFTFTFLLSHLPNALAASWQDPPPNFVPRPVASRDCTKFFKYRDERLAETMKNCKIDIQSEKDRYCHAAESCRGYKKCMAHPALHAGVSYTGEEYCARNFHCPREQAELDEGCSKFSKNAVCIVALKSKFSTQPGVMSPAVGLQDIFNDDDAKWFANCAEVTAKLRAESKEFYSKFGYQNAPKGAANTKKATQ